MKAAEPAAPQETAMADAAPPPTETAEMKAAEHCGVARDGDYRRGAGGNRRGIADNRDRKMKAAEPAERQETTMADVAPPPTETAEMKAAEPAARQETAMADAAPPPTETAEMKAAEPAARQETVIADAPPPPTETAEMKVAEPAAQQETAMADAAPPPTETAETKAAEPAAQQETAMADAAPPTTESAKTEAAEPAAPQETAMADAAPPPIETAETKAAEPAMGQETAMVDQAPAATEAASPTTETAKTEATEPTARQETVVAEAVSPARSEPPPPETVKTEAAEPTARQESEAKPPSFDVVRVNPQGDAVIAGRADPGAEVTVKDAGNVVGKVIADERGEWVLVPEKPLPSGARQLSLEEKTVAGERKSSKDVVVLFVPGKTPKGEGEQRAPVAVLTPREGGGSKLLQAPPPPKPAETVKDPDPQAKPGASQDSSPATTDAPPTAAEGAELAKPEEEKTGEDLSLKVIDYDDEGRVVLSGKATPGSEVHAKFDDQTVGTGETDAAGDWQISPSEPVISGQHAIRIEEVDEGGVVLAKLNLAFSRATIKPGALAPGTVVIKPGNSLWRIARATYGMGIKYTLIFAANAEQISDPHLIYPDQIFVVPPDPASN